MPPKKQIKYMQLNKLVIIHLRVYSIALGQQLHFAILGQTSSTIQTNTSLYKLFSDSN